MKIIHCADIHLGSKMKTNLKEIKLLPINHSSKAAGITDYNKVTLYNISTYTDKEIQRIVTHEIAHTWAHELRKDKIIDYSYTNFGKAVKERKLEICSLCIAFFCILIGNAVVFVKIVLPKYQRMFSDCAIEKIRKETL
jgi:hypothetical protein